MRQLLVGCLVIIFLSSCLKQSIADAMIANEDAKNGSPSVATMTYAVNGHSVTTTVNHPDKQSPGYYQLACSKTFYPGTNFPLYNLECVGTTGEMVLTFFTDSLAVGNYTISGGTFPELFVLDYNNTNGVVVYPGDNININITSYTKGHISGNFSGALTPMMSGYPANSYGSPASILITKGSFKDVPIFY
jgi:hypothetical protein